jgi:hypothetical protein
MAERYRQRVVRADGRAINVVQRRAHLSYCYALMSAQENKRPVNSGHPGLRP